jgi:hypothetical protein
VTTIPGILAASFNNLYPRPSSLHPITAIRIVLEAAPAPKSLDADDITKALAPNSKNVRLVVILIFLVAC